MSHADSASINFRHRLKDYNEWYENALALDKENSCNEVFILSIMSETSLKKISSYFDEGRIGLRKLRVLTYNPDAGYSGPLCQDNNEPSLRR